MATRRTSLRLIPRRRAGTFAPAVVLAALTLFDGAAVAQDYFVNAGASGGGDGLSWPTAYQDLQAALDDAESAGGGEIWIASGTYTPGSGSTARSSTFSIPNNTTIYGGFAEGDGSLTDRTESSGPTVLSGNLGGVNAYHVVTFDTVIATLDGVTVTGGLADDTSIAAPNPDEWGGGIHIENGIVTLSRCVIHANSATYGGGVSVSHGANATLAGCLIYENTTADNGAGVWLSGYSGTTGSSALVVNSTIADNVSSSGNGGGIRVGGSNSLMLYNSILWDNIADGSTGLSGQLSVSGTATSEVKHSIVDGIGETDGNKNDNPDFKSAAEGDYSVLAGSPAIEAGDNARLPDGCSTWLTQDLLLDDRNQDGSEWASSAGGNDAGCEPFLTVVDIGAYEGGLYLDGTELDEFGDTDASETSGELAVAGGDGKIGLYSMFNGSFATAGGEWVDPTEACEFWFGIEDLLLPLLMDMRIINVYDAMGFVEHQFQSPPIAQIGQMYGYLNGSLIFVGGNELSTVLTAASDIHATVGYRDSILSNLGDEFAGMGATVPAGMSLSWDAAMSLTISTPGLSDQNIVADLIVMAPTGLSSMPYGNTQVNFTIIDADLFTITSLERYSGQRAHVAQGDARWGQIGGDPMLDNLGSGLNDGVRIDAGDTSGAMIHIGWGIGPGASAPIGAAVRYTANTLDSGGFPTSIGVDVALKQSFGVTITPDYLAFGLPTYTVSVLNNGAVCDVYTGLFMATIDTDTQRLNRFGTTADNSLSMILDLGAADTITINDPTFLGQAEVCVGNLILIELETSPPDYNLDSFEIFGANLPRMRLREFKAFGRARFSGFPLQTQGQGTLQDWNGVMQNLGQQGEEVAGQTVEELTISNIGSSGEDGVSIDLGSLRGGMATVNRGVAVGNPGTISFTSRGNLGSGLQDIASLTFDSDGIVVTVTPDYAPMGASSYTVHLFNDGIEVGSFPGILMPSVRFVDLPELSGIMPVCNLDWYCWVGLPGPTPVDVYDGALQLSTLVVDRIAFEHNVPVAPPLSNHTFSILTTHDELRILDLGAFQHGSNNTRTGQADLGQQGGELTVSNIGSSGMDGVTIDVPDRGSQVLEHSFSPDLEGVRWDYTGTDNNSDSVRVGTVWLEHEANSNIDADFSPVGADTILVELLLGGSVIASQSITNHTGREEIARIASYPFEDIWLTADARGLTGSEISSFLLELTGPRLISLDSGIVFIFTDSVRFTPSVTPGGGTVYQPMVVETFDLIGVSGTGPTVASGSLKVESIAEAPPICPPDVNGDGFLDNGDIAAFIAAFIAGDLAVDFNGDGFLDNGDIAAFISAFLAGC